jgi:hypothetical protein
MLHVCIKLFQTHVLTCMESLSLAKPSCVENLSKTFLYNACCQYSNAISLFFWLRLIVKVC